jgi:uncharacterized membrane protein (DUF373 family)
MRARRMIHQAEEAPMDTPTNGEKHRLIVAAEKVKRVVAGVLLVLMFIVLAIVVVELFWVPLTVMLPMLPGAGHVLLTEAQMLDTFGIFLSVLIALELVETVEVYFKKNEVHVEIVLLVALIALARKVVLIDLHDYEPVTILGLAALFIGLATAYVAVRWAKNLGPAQNDGE